MKGFILPAWIVPIVGLLVCVELPGATALVNHGDVWRWHKGSTAAQAGWKTAADANLDATWFSGAGGIGYADNTAETNQCKTILGDMRNAYSTVFMRRQFEVASVVDTNLHLVLTMDFDDGYIAWLDGVYVASANVASAPSEPASTALASASHESSRGNTAPTNPPQTNDLGPVLARLGVGTHTLAIIGLNNTLNSSDLILIPDLSLAVITNTANCVSGLVLANTTWSASNSPIHVCGGVTVSSGATLTIEAGTTVQFDPGVGLVVASGGRLIAEGTTNAPLVFSRAGASGNWDHITINGAAGSPESRITYARFDFNANSTGTPCIQVAAGTAFLDHLIFSNAGAPYIHVDGASFVISYCYFPTATVGFELCHGTGGVKAGGHGVFLRNFFGKASGYNDVVDFTGGNRPGQPIVHFIQNVVTGGDDDGWDLDGTDAWVEGNIFLHMHKNGGTPDSSSAVSGGNDSGHTSEITIIGNLIYDCDQAVDAKQGNFYTMINNTIVHQSHVGGVDTEGAVLILADAGTVEGAGVYLEGNIVVDAEQLTRNVTAAIVTFTNNFLPLPWSGPGGGNTAANPLLNHIPALTETHFTSWEGAQVMWSWFSLLAGSPAIAAGPNGLDAGGVIPIGASISGVPAGSTTNKSAVLHVGPNRSGNGIPVAGWPSGSGYVAYRWRLDGGAWSVETPINSPISLNGLSNGPHYVEVTGKRDSGLYQDDPLFGDSAALTRSPTWTVEGTTAPRLTFVARDATSVTLSFVASAGVTYTVEYTDDLGSALWLKLADVPAPSTTQTVPVPDLNPSPLLRVYRVVTPARP